MVADFIPHEEKIIAISFSTLCSEGVAGLIPYDKLAVISHSTKCSEGVADLVSDSLFLVSDSWACLVSDSRILVSDSLLPIRGKFLIRGLFLAHKACVLQVLAI